MIRKIKLLKEKTKYMKHNIIAPIDDWLYISDNVWDLIPKPDAFNGDDDD